MTLIGLLGKAGGERYIHTATQPARSQQRHTPTCVHEYTRRVPVIRGMPPPSCMRSYSSLGELAGTGVTELSAKLRPVFRSFTDRISPKMLPGVPLLVNPGLGVVAAVSCICFMRSVRGDIFDDDPSAAHALRAAAAAAMDAAMEAGGAFSSVGCAVCGVVVSTEGVVLPLGRSFCLANPLISPSRDLTGKGCFGFEVLVEAAATGVLVEDCGAAGVPLRLRMDSFRAARIGFTGTGGWADDAAAVATGATGAVAWSSAGVLRSFAASKPRIAPSSGLPAGRVVAAAGAAWVCAGASCSSGSVVLMELTDEVWGSGSCDDAILNNHMQHSQPNIHQYCTKIELCMLC